MIKTTLTWLPPLTVGVACLAAGVLAGFSIPRRDSQEAGEKELAEIFSTTGPEVRPHVSSQPKANYTSIFPKISPTAKKETAPAILRSVPPPENRQAQQTWLQGLATGDLVKLLEALCQSAGPSGLDLEEKALIGAALRQWWQRDSNGLLAWLRQLPSGGSKNYLLTHLLQWLASQDGQKAVALTESFKAQEPDWDSGKLLNKLVEKEARAAWEKPGVTAEEMLAIYSRAGRGNNCVGTTQRIYPQDFDYRKFLDGMVSLNRQDGKSPTIMPPDILDAWAKADPEAAIQWLVDYEANKQTNGEVPFVGWRSIMNGVIARSGTMSYHRWAAQIVTQSDADLREMVIRQSNEADLVGIVQQIGDAAQRDEVLAAAIQNSEWRRDDMSLLALISTPEARLKVIAKKFNSNWIARGKTDPGLWQRIGLTQEQVDAALAESEFR